MNISALTITSFDASPGLGSLGLPSGLLAAQQRLAAPLPFASASLAPAAPPLSPMTSLMVGMLDLLLGLMSNRQGSNALSLPSASSAGTSAVSGAASAAGAQAPASSGGPKVQKLMDAALSKQGSPYVFGAAGPDKFDCSGLVSYALKQAGSNVGRMTAEGYRKHYANARVEKNDLKPGDLVFFWSPNDRGIPKGQATHIEIYLGNGKTMGTDSPKEGAKVEPINWDTFIGGARPPELQG